VLSIATTLLAGCYNYEPLGRAHLVPSRYLALTLTESGSVQLMRYLGPSVLIVRGRFLSVTDSGLALSVTSVEDQRGQSVTWQGETVVIPGNFVRALEARHVARTKTTLLVGASVVGFLAANAAFGPGASGTVPAGGARSTTPR
jgi:hypothetical protein